MIHLLPGGPMKYLFMCGVGTMLAAVLGSCGRAPAGVAPEPQLTIAQGAGTWVIFQEEVALDNVIERSLEVPYATSGVVVSGSNAVTRIRLQLHATPLHPEDRCGLQLEKIIVVTTDGHEHSAPASGHVTDNSDGLNGMRVEVSRNSGAGLVIPASATGTVVFEQPVQVSLKD